MVSVFLFLNNFAPALLFQMCRKHIDKISNERAKRRASLLTLDNAIKFQKAKRDQNNEAAALSRSELRTEAISICRRTLFDQSERENGKCFVMYSYIMFLAFVEAVCNNRSKC
jgi:hypothetical protein